MDKGSKSPGTMFFFLYKGASDSGFGGSGPSSESAAPTARPRTVT